MLQVIYAAEREHCIHHDAFAEVGFRGTPGPLVINEYISDPNDPDQVDWNYTSPVLGPAGVNTCGPLLIRATRSAGSNAGESIDIDENGVIDNTGWNP